MKAKAFILGGYVNGLGLVRSLARIGVESVVFDVTNSIAGSSRWATAVRCPHPTNDTSAFLQSLLTAADKEPEPPVLFATNDIWLVPILEHEALLRPSMQLPMSSWEVVRPCYDKWRLIQLALHHGVPTPRTFRVDSPAELRELENRVPYPAILKPVDTIGFLEALKRRGRSIRLGSPSDLQAVGKDLERAGLTSRTMIVQEFIPGSTEGLYTYTSYSNGVVRAIMGGIPPKPWEFQSANSLVTLFALDRLRRNGTLNDGHFGPGDKVLLRLNHIAHELSWGS